MGFYQQISKYYDLIFPVGEEQLRFLKEVAGNPPKAILDIACGTGGYSLELGRMGYNMTASDLDGRMLEQLEDKSKAEGCSVTLVESDMLKLDQKLSARFNMAFCIGNSIVHLQSLQQIRDFLTSTKSLLENEGSLVLQIINFDRIILRDVRNLPTIENKNAGLTFERNYDYDKANNIMTFRTRLNVEGVSLENQVPLYPLLQEELVEAVRAAGFKKQRLFGDFNGNEFDKYNSYMLVLWAK